MYSKIFFIQKMLFSSGMLLFKTVSLLLMPTRTNCGVLAWRGLGSGSAKVRRRLGAEFVPAQEWVDLVHFSSNGTAQTEAIPNQGSRGLIIQQTYKLSSKLQQTYSSKLS